jgi:regulator of sirC expression with transglutaminase-like and TPR domain
MNGEKELREIQALIRLIDEPDTAMYGEISRKIFSYGTEIIPFLEQEWEQSEDAFIQDRIEELIHKIHVDQVYSDLDNWVAGGGSDLLRACIIIARYHYPQLIEQDIHNYIGQLRKDIWIEMNDNLTALEKVKLFNHFFYMVYGFAGDNDTYHSPSNSFINKVLESKRGNPLSLSIIYMLVAQSLDMPVFGINLPGRFVLGYTGNEADFEDPGMGLKQKILFYIDVFSGGNLFSASDVQDFIKAHGHEPAPEFIEPCTNMVIVRRLLNNLSDAYDRAGHTGRVKEIDRLKHLLKPQVLL